MSEERTRELLRRGAEALKVGEREAAREALLEAGRLAPDNPQVWAGLALAADDLSDRRRYLLEVLRCDPGNPWALAGLSTVEEQERAATTPEPDQPAAPEPAPSSFHVAAPLPSPDPWGDDPAARRCAACATVDPGLPRCRRCGTATTLQVGRPRTHASGQLFTFLLAVVIGRLPWLGIVAVVRLGRKVWQLAPWALYVGATAPLLAVIAYGFWRERRWAWRLGLGYTIVDLQVMTALSVLGRVDPLIWLISLVFDLMMLGLLLRLSDDMRVVEQPIVLPPEELWPQTPLGLYNAGVEHSQRKHWYLAARLWQQAVARDYGTARYRRALGTAYLWLDELGSAEVELRAAAQLDPDDAQTAGLLDILREKQAGRGRGA